MKSKVRLVVYLPRRLYRILEDIAPVFEDREANDPNRGALTRALEYVLQIYMESEDYVKKRDIAFNIKKERLHLFELFSKFEMEYQRKLREKKS